MRTSRNGNQTFADLPIGAIYTPESQWPDQTGTRTRVKVGDNQSIAFSDRIKTRPSTSKPRQGMFVVLHA